MNDNKNTTAAQPLDLDKLEALARAATPGPWDVNQASAMKNGRLVVDELYVYSPETRNVAITADIADPSTGEMSRANADFIATANPQTVLALISQARASQPEGATLASQEKTTGASVKTWQERAQNVLGDRWRGYKPDSFMEAEIADLRNEVTNLRAQLAAKRQGEPVAIRWPAVRKGKWQFADVNDTVSAEALEHPDLQSLYLAAPASAQPDRGAAQFCQHCGYDHSVGPLCKTAADISPASQPVAPEATQAGTCSVCTNLEAQLRSVVRQRDAAISAHAQQEAAPDGYVLVPKVPTAPMLTAIWNRMYYATAPAELDEAYAAMLAVAHAAVAPSDAKDATVPDHSERGAANAGEMLALLKDSARAWNNESESELDATMERIECFLLDSRRKKSQSPATVEDKTIAAGKEAANARRLSENDMRDIAVEAGLWPNTIDCWLPALRRYTDAVLARQSPATIAAGQEAANAKDAALADVLNTTLWLYRRLPQAYGNPPFVDKAILVMAERLGLDDVPAAIKERAAMAAAPSSEKGGA